MILIASIVSVVGCAGSGTDQDASSAMDIDDDSADDSAKKEADEAPVYNVFASLPKCFRSAPASSKKVLSINPNTPCSLPFHPSPECWLCKPVACPFGSNLSII